MTPKYCFILYHRTYAPQGLLLGFDLSFQGGLHGVHGPLKVLPRGFKLLIFLLETSFDLLASLGQEVSQSTPCSTWTPFVDNTPVPLPSVPSAPCSPPARARTPPLPRQFGAHPSQPMERQNSHHTVTLVTGPTATNLKTPLLLIQLVDRPPPLSQLVQQVLDLLGQVLVLPSHAVQLLHSLVPGCAQAKQLRTGKSFFLCHSSSPKAVVLLY